MKTLCSMSNPWDVDPVEEALRKGGLAQVWDVNSEASHIRHRRTSHPEWERFDPRTRCQCSGRLPLVKLIPVITTEIAAVANLVSRLSCQCKMVMTGEDLLCDACREHCHVVHNKTGQVYQFPLIGRT
jgi:hypothetical protein